MSTEVEIRALVSDLEAFQAMLAENGFENVAIYEQRDIIFDDKAGTLFRAGRKRCRARPHSLARSGEGVWLDR